MKLYQRFHDVGLPDVLATVSGRDMRFASAFWTGMHEAALGASLIFGRGGPPHHSNTTSRVERVRVSLSADSAASSPTSCTPSSATVTGATTGRTWRLVPLVWFALNNAASSLGCGYTPFYADRGQCPGRPLTRRPARTRPPPPVRRQLRQGRCDPQAHGPHDG